MKKILPFIILAFLLSQCSKDTDNGSVTKGLVSFEEEPYFSGGNIYFAISIEFAGVGKEVSIPWEILDGTSVIESGKGNTVNNDELIMMFWWTNAIQVDIDEVALSGKTLVVYLDPDHKFTLPDYTSEEQVNLWKKTSVAIP